MTSRADRRTVVVLISGRGTNMRAIAARAAAPGAGFEVRAVVSDQPAAAGLAIARELDIETHVVVSGGSDRVAYGETLARVTDDFEPDVIALAGFMRILSGEFVRRYTGRLLNVHPSLLPRYRGLGTHRRVLAAGDAEHGASVHFVTEELDAGPVIIQGRVPVLHDDTVESLSARVQAVEHTIYPLAVELVARGRITLRDGAVHLGERRLDTPLPAHYEEAFAS